MPSKLVRWSCVVVWMIVIFAFSHQPYSGKVTEKYFGGANVPIRKMGHVTEFMVLFLLVRWALTAPRRERENGTETANKNDSVNKNDSDNKDKSDSNNVSADTTRGVNVAAASNSTAVLPAKLLLSPSVIAFYFSLLLMLPRMNGIKVSSLVAVRIGTMLL